MTRNLCHHFYKIQIFLFLSLFSSPVIANISFHSKSSAWIVSEGEIIVSDTTHLYGWKDASVIKDNAYTGNNWTGYPSSPWNYANLPSLDVINNSNAINYYAPTIRNNSRLLSQTSNALITDIGNLRTTSNALLYGLRINSNAIVTNAINIKTNSNSIVKNNIDIKSNSNAIISLAASGMGVLATQNSNAINYYAPIIRNDSRLLKQTSDAFIYNLNTSGAEGIKNNSNAIIVLDKLTKQNSNAIVSGGGGSEINYEGNLTIAGPTYTLAHNRFANPVSSNIYFTGNTTFNGNNNYIQFSDSPSSIHVSPGVTVIFSNTIFKDLTDTVFNLSAGAQVIFDTGTVIEIMRPTTLNQNWIFTGDSLIYGYNNTLDLANSNIQISSNSTLTIHSLNITGLKNNNLSATSSNDRITLQNAALILSNNFSYSTGALRFENDVLITGTNTFTYATDQISTIASQSHVILDTGVTFEYNAPIANRDLLTMTDQTSRLILNGCTLSSTTTGLRLTKGTLVIEHKNNLYNTGATSLSEAINLGNGTPNGELTIEIKPGASIDLKSGILNYENV
ncbi:MAG: hypothetical protein ABH827_03960 [bacterium]